jgi:peptidoglycan hydrolase FlgJ
MTTNAALIDPQVMLQAMQGAKPPMRTQTAAQAKQAAQDFEAQFLSQMVQHMFTGIKSDSMFGGGQGEEMFRSMMYDEYGKILARHGGVGIAAAVERELLKTQEGN